MKTLIIGILLTISSLGYTQNGVTLTSLSFDSKLIVDEMTLEGSYLFGILTTDVIKWEYLSYDNKQYMEHFFKIKSVEYKGDNKVYHVILLGTETKSTITYHKLSNKVIINQVDTYPLILSGDITFQ